MSIRVWRGHGRESGRRRGDTSGLRDAVTVDGVRVHQQALQDIADANGGTRRSGSPGYDASAQYVHATPVEDTLEALEAIRASGQCAQLGACNVDASQLLAALEAAERTGVVGYEVIQNGHHLLDLDGDHEVRALCAERGLAYTAYSPLAGGALTGKYRPDQPAPSNSRLALRPEGYDELLTSAVYEAIDQLRDAASERGASCGALAIAWLIHDPSVTALITGPSRTAPHLALATEALRVEIDHEFHAEISGSFRGALAR